MSREINVVVIEDHEILRVGLVAALVEDRGLTVTTPASPGALEQADIAVVSSEVARRDSFTCPIIVYTDDPERTNGTTSGNDIAGTLHFEHMTAAQLRATVHAAAAGLRVNAQLMNGAQPVIEPRTRRVLELLADGYSTREIAEQMSYSERTIKKLVTSLQHRLDARSRAHLVAQAARRGLI